MFLSSVLLSFFFPVLPFKKYCLFCISTLEDKDLADSYPFPLPRRLSRGAAQRLVTLQGCGIYIAMVAEFLVLRVSPLVFPLPPLALLGFLCFFSLVFSGSPRALGAAVRWWEPLMLTACSASRGPCVLEPPAPLRLCCFLPLLSNFTPWSCLGRVRRWAASQKQATLSTRTGPFEGMWPKAKGWWKDGREGQALRSLLSAPRPQKTGFTLRVVEMRGDPDLGTRLWQE